LSAHALLKAQNITSKRLIYRTRTSHELHPFRFSKSTSSSKSPLSKNPVSITTIELLYNNYIVPSRHSRTPLPLRHNLSLLLRKHTKSHSPKNQHLKRDDHHSEVQCDFTLFAQHIPVRRNSHIHIHPLAAPAVQREVRGGGVDAVEEGCCD